MNEPIDDYIKLIITGCACMPEKKLRCQAHQAIINKLQS